MSAITESLDQIILEETKRDNFTQIPNIIFDLVEEDIITPFAQILYNFYRKVAGEEGACWMGMRKIAEKTKLSLSTITRARKELERPIARLGGLPLIKIRKGDRKSNETDTITIVDIWRVNKAKSKNSLTCFCGKQGCFCGKHNKIYTYQDIPPPPLPPPSKTQEVESSRPKTDSEKSANLHYVAKKPLHADNQDASLEEEEFIKKKGLLEQHGFSPTEIRRLAKYLLGEIQDAIEKFKDIPPKKGRMNLLMDILKHPGNYVKQEQKPKKLTRAEFKEKILKNFKRDGIYNGFECLIDDIGIGFNKSGMRQPYSIHWNDNDLENKFNEILHKIGLK